MTFSKLSLLTLPALGLGVFVAPMTATSVTGGATISGNVQVSATQIIFSPAFTNQGPGPATGSFSGLTTGVYNTSTLTFGVTTLPVVDFMTFNGGVATPINFDLQGFAPGFGTAAGCTSNAIGSECTPANSPFTLVQGSTNGTTPNEVLVHLTLNGIAYTGTSASGSSASSGVYSTQLEMGDVCDTITSCLTLLSGGQSIAANYAANFTAIPPTITPEPGSLLLLGVGLIGAGSFTRLKLRKR